MSDNVSANPFDAETWAQLPSFFDNLPEPVKLIMWGDEVMTSNEKKAATICRLLADRFEGITFQTLPRRVNFHYYPVIGIMGDNGPEQEWIDFDVRIIGLPTGYQMTSFVTAVQSVALHGMTLEARTRIQLSRLKTDIRLELISSAADEHGPIMAQMVFNMAVVNPHVRSFLIMSDQFPEAVLRYSVNYVPHVVINGRVHVEVVVSEEVLLKQMALAAAADAK